MKQNEIVHKNVIFIPSHNENNKSYIELLTHKLQIRLYDLSVYKDSTFPSRCRHVNPPISQNGQSCRSFEGVTPNRKLNSDFKTRIRDTVKYDLCMQ